MERKMVSICLAITLVITMIPKFCLTVDAAAPDEWNEFLSNRAFWDYMSDSTPQSHNENNLDYAVYDLNADGVSELLLQDVSNAPFYSTWLFVLHNGKIVLANEGYGYGKYRYSPKYNMVIGSPETKPTADTGISPFYSLSGTEFRYEFYIGKDMGECFCAGASGKITLSDEEYSLYYEDVVWLPFSPVNEIPTPETSKQNPYSIEEIEQLVAAYYNEKMGDDTHPGTYVVFSSETAVSGNLCNVVVRFQGATAAASNIFIADVSVHMTTGEMFINGDSRGYLWGNRKEDVSADQESNPPQKTDEEINAMNALLIGVQFYPEKRESDVSKWSDETICDVIYAKLLWDNFAYSDSSFLRKIGLEYWESEDWNRHFDLKLIQEITQATLGRDFPSSTPYEHILVSGDELIISPAVGECTVLSVLDYFKQGDRIIAIGTAVHHNNADSVFLGYFQAVFEENSSSVYGYSLLSLSSIESNQNFSKLTASASSELKEETITHLAENVLDGDLGTAWVEGVRGIGINEWIKLETTDDSKMDVSVIEFSLGYQKNNDLLQKNGWPHKVLIECEGGYRQEAEFLDYNDAVVLDQAVKTSWIKITILEASAGSKYDDTCISEICLRGIDTTTYLSKYLEDNPVLDSVELKAYTAFPESSIGTEQEVKIQFSLYVNDELTPIKEYALGISNPSVIESTETTDSDGSRIITFKGLIPGSSDLTFTENSTGTSITVTVTVEDRCNYFRCSAFPVPYESIGSIYVADYSCKVNDHGSHDITFNAYNTSYAYGVVEVYNENGSLIKLVPLDPRSDGSGMEKVVNGFKWVWEDIKDFFDGDTPFYTKDSNAKHTPVKLDNIPENAEIVISSDGNISDFAILYTGVDVFVRTVFAASSIDLKTDGQEETVKELMSALADSLIKSISHEETEKLIKEGFIKEAAESISTSIAFASSTESISDIYETVYNLFQSLDIDTKSIMLEVLKGMGYSVADAAFTTAVPLYKLVNFADQILESAWPLVDYQFNLDRGKMEIHVSKHGLQNFVANSSVTVTQQSNFNDHTVLDAYEVVEIDELSRLSDSIPAEMTNYAVYNITLREDGVEVQPNGEIEVRLPVPYGADGEKCVVYRIEENGERTLLQSCFEDDYVTFTTTHLSYYVIGQTSESAPPVSTDDMKQNHWRAIGVGALVLGSIIFVTMLAKRKKVSK